MGNKVFVGGLSWNTDDDGLRQGFERFGAVQHAKVVKDHDTGKSRGFGFVTFDSGDDAQRAITEMDGENFDGRQIKVNEAIDRPRN